MNRSDRLSEIEERAAKATPGPWRPGEMPEWESWMIVSESAFDPGDDEDPTPIKRPIVDCEETAPADAEFIAHAREDVPWLLAEIAQLEDTVLRQTKEAIIAEQKVFELGRELERKHGL